MKKVYLFILFLWINLSGFAQSKLVLGEFYWDTDPGFGNGLVFANLDSLQTLDSTFLIATNGLSAGMHTLYVRFQDDDGNWSQSVTQQVMIAPEAYNPGEDPKDMRQIEYYWDTGDTTVASINGVVDYEFTKDIPTTGLGLGNHVLNYRFKDAYGLWSTWQLASVFIHGEAPGVGITKIEYFVGNTDPGLDAATSVSFTPFSMPDVTADFEVPTNGLPVGMNIITVRAKDANGVWSAFYRKAFNVDNSFSLTAGNIAILDYCRGAEVTVPFTSTGTFLQGNSFTIQISDQNGNNFVDVPTTQVGNTLKFNVPNTVGAAMGYRVRVMSSLPLIRSLSASVLTFKVKPHVSLTGNTTINFGQSALVTAITTGTFPTTYVVNGVSQVTNSTGTSFSVSPTITTHYTLSTASNECGIGTVNTTPVVITVICPNSLTHGTGTLPDNVYQAATSIVSQKKAINTPLSYRAGNSITLNAGFEVSGSVFQAQIGGCL